MVNETFILMGTAASIALLHTVMGPDHFLPFVALGKSRGWTKRKMAFVTMGCGLGHSVGSILLGLLGIWAGTAIGDLAIIEGFRGDIAAWALTSAGLVYMIYGLRKAAKGKTHSHAHTHADGTTHNHNHAHQTQHSHLHPAKEGAGSKASIMPWSIFIIFVLGPCEPLIPLMMYPAATASPLSMILVVGTFVFVTIATMTIIALIVFSGLKFLPVESFQRYTHAIAGATLSLCGFAIVGLGL